MKSCYEHRVSRALPFAVTLLLAACSGPEPEELCAHTQKLFDREMNDLMEKAAPIGPEKKKLFDEVQAEHVKEAADCALTYKMIKEGSPRSKYKAFAACHLSKRTMDELKECPKLLSEKAP